MLDEREHEKCFYFCNQVEYIDDRLSNLKVCIMRIPSPEGPESLQCWATKTRISEGVVNGTRPGAQARLLGHTQSCI